MRVAIIGYGKMGKIIEEVLISRHHEVTWRISKENQDQLIHINPANTDVCIEFTGPDSAFENLLTLASNGNKIVCGSTGWYSRLSEIESMVRKHQGGLIAASNFSIGVNLFFSFASKLSAKMSEYKDYQVSISETHHIHKKDAPSGTAITLFQQIVPYYKGMDGYVLNADDDGKIRIDAIRKDDVPGTHELKFQNQIDSMELIHTAFNRRGFAEGAVLAAEFILDRIGIYTMNEVLGLDKA